MLCKTFSGETHLFLCKVQFAFGDSCDADCGCVQRTRIRIPFHELVVFQYFSFKTSLEIWGLIPFHSFQPWFFLRSQPFPLDFDGFLNRRISKWGTPRTKGTSKTRSHGQVRTLPPERQFRASPRCRSCRRPGGRRW